MLNFSLTSVWFIALLIISPIILNNNWKVRKYIYFAICLSVYILTMNFSGTYSFAGPLLAFAAWVIIPYLYVKIFPRLPKFPIIIAIVCAFIWMNQYFLQYLPGLGKIFLPFRLLGLSYILFKQIDFILINTDSQAISKRKFYDFVDYVNYLISFWTVLAGPIQRFDQFVKDFYEERAELSGSLILKSLHRAANGFIKVVVLAPFFSSHAVDLLDLSFGSVGQPALRPLYFILYCILNAVYIYLDFSGYCDVVISFSSLSGFTVPENFDKPYLARNMQEFWNRWHITLSTWIRDFLYQPMFKKLISGIFSSRIEFAQYISLFITFLLAGIWHGTDFNYVVYGVLQGAGVILSTLYVKLLKKKMGNKKYKIFSQKKKVIWAERVVCMLYVSISFGFVGNDIIGRIF